MQESRTYVNYNFLCFLSFHISVSGLFLVRTGKHGEERKRSQRLFVGGASTA